ncbi:MAG: ATP-dependent DNA helicase [Lachnospiraceae bacterium]|nr:ATP-dependent DNA helicase [Lachnospiraceae bacterium]
MDEKLERRISVRNLVEFILRNGDIDERSSGTVDYDAASQGAKLHRKLQAKAGSQYHSEVTLSVTMPIKSAILTVWGRADGVIEPFAGRKEMTKEVLDIAQKMDEEKKAFYTIDEIKTMYRDVFSYEEPELLHLAQAKCYAYIYLRNNHENDIAVRITYANLETEAIKRFWYFYSFDELEEWFFNVVSEYSKFVEFEIEHAINVKETAKKLEFPFEYRKGQKELASFVYSSILRKERAFCQAPTGVGKTMSAVFPAIKAIGEGLVEKVFYATAKTVTRTVAEESMRILKSKGLVASSITLTAKDKLCILDEHKCNPDACKRAKGHYDRVNACILDIITNELDITKDVIEEYARAYEVCPFELSLDVALYCDLIICDYNYIFDPTVRLKRFFSESNFAKYEFLVDEAHNLVDRGRDMFSAEIIKEKVLVTKNNVKDYSKKASNRLASINKILLSLLKELSNSAEDYMIHNSIDEFVLALRSFVGVIENDLQNHIRFKEHNKVMEFFFDVLHFINMYDSREKGYIIYSERIGNDNIRIKLFCVNPANQLKNIYPFARSTVLFSATLLPINYYKELLTADTNDKAIYINSPFDNANRLLATTSGVTSLYKDRSEDMYKRIVEYIDKGSLKQGNYMAFFSSYKFMNDCYDVAKDKIKDKELIVQDSNMSEDERIEFLNKFDTDNDKTMIAFCILGGVFSEGIDLANEKLIGAFVVGNGLPQVCVERKLLNEYFAKKGLDGFSYAYIYPGMNKVLQAAGRVIRTENDKGIILLMDDRFKKTEYYRLFPREWNDIKNLNLNILEENVKNFWKE